MATQHLKVVIKSRRPLLFLLLLLLLLLYFCVTFAESEPYCHSKMFVWMSVGHSTTYSLPRLIDHNQIWLACIYRSSDPCKPFWIPCLPYFGCQSEKYAKFRLFPTIKGCHLDIRTQIKKADVSRCVCRWRVLCPNISKLDHEL